MQLAPQTPSEGAPATSLRPSSLSVTPFNAPASVFPGATTTELTGIRTGLITATVTVPGGTMGGLYVQKHRTWLQMNYPGAASSAAYGPQVLPGGYRVVGSYKLSGSPGDHGFVYDSLTKKWATIDAPAKLCAPKQCNYTIAHSAYGSATQYAVVGNYDAVPVTSAAPGAAPISGHAFLYDARTSKPKFLTIDVPNELSTTAYGIWVDGATVAIAGGYTDKKGTHAYVRDVVSGKLLTFNYPAKTILTHFEGITGAGGAGSYNVIGDYTDLRNGAVYGFFLQIRNWTAGTPVLIGKLTANSVNNRTVIGVYNPGSGPSGFVTEVPVQDPP